MENPDSYRMMFFQARMGNTSPLGIFTYSPSLYAAYTPDPDGTDHIRNAKEWQAVAGTDVAPEDILSILYETAPDSLLNAVKENALKTVFDENSFILALTKPGNKLLLEYLIFSKQVEASENEWNGHESWDSEPGQTAAAKKTKGDYLVLAKKRLSAVKTDFLRKRYAFQICRLAFELEQYNLVEKTYESRYKKFLADDLMNVWSAHYYAIALDHDKKAAKANYFYSLCFDACDSKKLRCHQLFHTDENTFNAALKLAKTPHEKAVMWIMRIINNPGPALNALQTIVQLDPKSPYLTFLIAREINKLEDWICTPVFTPNLPAACPQWNLQQALVKNMAADLLYLKQFKQFVAQLQQQARGELHQYLTLGLAHLCFISDNNKEGLDFLNSIGLSENSSIEVQKNIEKAWVMAKTTDISDDIFKDQFVIYCHKLQRLAKNDNNINKTLYSLLLGVAAEYEKRHDFATAGLLTMKADQFKQRYDPSYAEDFPVTADDNYQKLSYFDKNATYLDIENLIKVLSKAGKSDFEDFITDQPLGSVNLYRDLQGTIAFRQNDLKTAYSVFKKIDAGFWRTHYAYKDCLNEDPFIPKVLNKSRNFTYLFDKAKFLKRLLDLQDKARKKSGIAEYALLLGNAYFNCSYFGNSWMMVEYGWSCAESPTESAVDSLGYTNIYLTYKLSPDRSALNPLKDDNYYNCRLAVQYYRQACDDPKASNEQKAYALLMLHKCAYLSWELANYHWYDENKPRYTTDDAIKELYNRYADTRTFKDYKCPLLDSFIASK
jgi:thioredoxin-related protein